MARRLSPAAGRRWDGSLVVVLLRVGYGRSRPAAAAFHRGGDPEAALPAAGAPDDGTLLGEEPGAGTWPLYLLACPCLAHSPRRLEFGEGTGPGRTPWFP